MVKHIVKIPRSTKPAVSAKEKSEQENVDEYITNFLSTIKPKSDLLVPVECMVLAVNGSTKHTYFTPESEIMIGGYSPSYRGGNIEELVLSIEPVDPNIPVRELHYAGLPPIEAGDIIRAYVFKGKEEHCLFGEEIAAKAPERIHYKQRGSYAMSFIDYFGYAERPFFEKEETTKIEKIKGGKIVATYIVKGNQPRHDY